MHEDRIDGPFDDSGLPVADGARISAVTLPRPTSAADDAAGPGGGGWLTRQRRNLWLLAAVAVGFGILQLVTFGLNEPFGWDETVYLSQLNPAVPNFPWGSQRAWGIVLLGLPVVLFDIVPPTGRAYFVLLSSLALFVAFRPWLSVRNTVAVPLAAGVFGTLFTNLYLARLDLPNLYTGLGAVATTGFFLLARRSPTRPALIGLGGATAFTTLMRPTDSVWLVTSLGLIWLVSRPRHVPIAVAVAVGEVVGWLPWLIESFIRFGGPFARLREASEAVGGSGLHLDGDSVGAFLWMWDVGQFDCRYGADGSICPPAGDIGAGSLIWWLVAVALAGCGVAVAVRAGRRAESLVPLAVGLGMAFPYLFMARYTSLRFFAPAEVLLSLPIAHGLLSVGVLRRGAARIVGCVALAALLLTHVIVQIEKTEKVAVKRAYASAWTFEAVDHLRDIGVSAPCLIYGEISRAVAYPLHCRVEGAPVDYLSVEPVFAAEARARGESVVALVDRKALPRKSYLRKWRLVGTSTPYLTLYLAPS